MYGQGGNNEHDEVKLIRMAPHDNRVNKKGRKRRRRNRLMRTVSLLAVVTFLVIAGVTACYYIFRLPSEAQQVGFGEPDDKNLQEID